MAKRLSRNLLGLLASLAAVVAAPLLGVAFTAMGLREAFDDTARADAAHKARLLAEGISFAMNATVVGLVVGALAIVPAIIFGVRLYREPKAKDPAH